MASPPNIQDFLAKVEARFDRERLETFWDLQEPLQELLQSRFFSDALTAELQKLVENAAFMGEWLPNQMVLHRGQGYALSIWMFETSKRYVHSTPYLAMYAPLGSEPLAFTRYDLPPGWINDVFDPAMRIHSPESGQVLPGEVLRLQTERYAYDFSIESPVAVVELTAAPFQSMEWLFNKETGYAWQANDGELRATQLRVAAYILSRLADPSSVDPLKRMAEHPHHAVRWAAIQGLGRINRSAAIEKLEQSTTDPHPHIRSAAAKTLAQLKKRE